VTRSNDQENLVTALDAQQLAEHLDDVASPCDLAYLDPPYNQHPYGSNYHVLNTIALGDQPPIGPTIGGFGDKSAIRRDWRTARRSAYNSRREALPALERLLDSIRSRFILLSYSTDGLIPVQSLVEAACRRGAASAVVRRYKRYRVSAQRFSRRAFNVEFVLIVDARARPRPEQAAALVAEVYGAEIDCADSADSLDSPP